eukprot:1180136-Prorocentrum_minimum.AAC.1
MRQAVYHLYVLYSQPEAPTPPANPSSQPPLKTPSPHPLPIPSRPSLSEPLNQLRSPRLTPCTPPPESALALPIDPLYAPPNGAGGGGAGAVARVPLPGVLREEPYGRRAGVPGACAAGAPPSTPPPHPLLRTSAPPPHPLRTPSAPT